MISQKLLVCLLLLLPCIFAASYNYTGTLQGSQTFKVLTYPVPSGYNLMSIEFKVYNAYYSNVLIIPSLINDFPTLTPKQITSQIISEDSLLSRMDVISAIGGYSQIMNFIIPSPYPSSIYIGLYNFDSPEVNFAKFFYVALKFTMNTVLCRGCASGSDISNEHTNDLSCQCTPCGLNRVGVSCQYSLNPLQPGSSQKLNVLQSKDLYHIIKNTGKAVKLSIKEITNYGTVVMYMQYQYRVGLIAGKLNSHYVKPDEPLIFTFSSNQTTIQIENLYNYDILLTVKNYGPNLGKINMKYISETQKSSDSLTLVFAVVFSLVGAAIIFLVLFKIITNCRTRRAIVLHINHNNLTSQQINKFFPSIQATSLFGAKPKSELLQSQDSITDLNSTSVYNYECSICYDNLKIDDLIRVTYCRHIFHSKCLEQWFSKSQNCPNCRMSSEYEETKNQRKVFTREEKKKPQLLIKAILGSKFLEELMANVQVKKWEQKKEIDKLDEKDFQIEVDKKTDKANEVKMEQY